MSYIKLFWIREHARIGGSELSKRVGFSGTIDTCFVLKPALREVKIVR